VQEKKIMAESQEILVVVSKLKKYIKDHGGMNTAGSVADEVSKRVRNICDRAIDSARQDGRKTVMDRDIPV
jgi:histone H3/H4